MSSVSTARKERLVANGITKDAAQEIVSLCKSLSEAEFDEVLTTALIAAREVVKKTALTPVAAPAKLTSVDLTMQMLTEKYKK